MKDNNLKIYKKILKKEEAKIQSIIDNLHKNQLSDFNTEIASEISHYDNHPADAAGDIYDMEIGMALKNKEEVLLRKVQESLGAIEKGTYGKCKSCGNEISLERLSFIPYAEYCMRCQKEISLLEKVEKRPVEEEVIGIPFSYENKAEDYAGFDEKDSYRAVERFNRIEDLEDSYEDDNIYVEPIEKISNAQYKAGLPD